MEVIPHYLEKSWKNQTEITKNGKQKSSRKDSLGFTHFFFPALAASPALVFLTPRIFLALFFLSFICFLDFSTFVSSPFYNHKLNSRNNSMAKERQGGRVYLMVVPDTLDRVQMYMLAHIMFKPNEDICQLNIVLH